MFHLNFPLMAFGVSSVSFDMQLHAPSYSFHHSFNKTAIFLQRIPFNFYLFPEFSISRGWVMETLSYDCPIEKKITRC